MDVYAFGFNGFQQISQLHERDAQNKSTLTNVPPYFDRPVKLNVTTDGLSSCLITWSKLRFRRNSDSTQTEDTPFPVAASWTRAVYRTADGQYITGDGADMSHTTVRVDVGTRVDDVVGGEDKLYCIHDGGRLSEIVDGSTDSKEDNPREGSDGKVAFLRQVFTISPVTSLSCGKEHVLFLTKNGHVYSFGLGSRGQLGHDSVEKETEPRMVDCLDGLCVVDVAAGGWHSAAVTASGDLFSWGWNESGQLGHSTGQVLDTDATASHDVSIEGTSEDSSSLTQIRPNQTIDPALVQLKGVDQESRQSSRTVIVKRSRDSPHNLEDQCSNPTQRLPICSNALNEEKSSLGASKELPEAEKSIDERELGCEDDGRGTDADENHGKVVDVLKEKLVAEARLSLLSSPLLVTSVPHDYTAVKVSCGSRHTAVVTDDGVLYTSGWNKYGQLGQGHTKSCDVFKAVSLTSVKVIDVKCGCWNTVIITENETLSAT